MKKLIAVLMCIGLPFLFACKDDGKTEEEKPSAGKKNESSGSEEGEKHNPPIKSADVPEGSWFCDMSDTAHFVRPVKGDGECPVCGMKLVEKKGGAGD